MTTMEPSKFHLCRVLMRAKAACTCGIAVDVGIMRIRCSCLVKNFVNEVEQTLRTGAKEQRSKGAKERRRRGHKLCKQAAFFSWTNTPTNQPAMDSLVFLRIPAKDARGRFSCPPGSSRMCAVKKQENKHNGARVVGLGRQDKQRGNRRRGNTRRVNRHRVKAF